MKKRISLIYIEDNEIDVLQFEKLILQFPDIDFLQSFIRPSDALAYCKENKPDLAIIDIKFEENDSGLWLADELSKLGIAFAFLTDFKHYAIQAFDLFAIHYLVKPVTAPQIREVIVRYNEFKGVYAGDSAGKEEKNKNDFPKRIYVNTQKEIFILQVDEIVYVESNGSYTTFHMIDGKSILSGRNFKKYSDQLLSHPNFARVHRSYIINQSHLQSIFKRKSGSTFQFENGMEINVASFRKDEWMDNFFK